jgi:uncharacterized membrane protein YkvA (DUF1232 family)
VLTRLKLYNLVLRDPRTPRLAKISLWLALGYLALPFDLIPDVLPVIGHLDDVLIVGGLVYLALKLIPRSVLDDCRRIAAA